MQQHLVGNIWIFLQRNIYIYIYQEKYHISDNSNKLTNEMQEFHKFITWSLCVAQHVSVVSTPIIRSL
jgi:hypothetical protein